MVKHIFLMLPFFFLSNAVGGYLFKLGAAMLIQHSGYKLQLQKLGFMKVK